MKETTHTHASSAPVTVAAMLEQGQQQFEAAQIYFGHGTTSAWDEAVYLLSYVLDLPPGADRSLLSQAAYSSNSRPIFRPCISEELQSVFPPPISLARPGSAACPLPWISG